MSIGLKERDNEYKTFGADGIGNILKRILKRRMALWLHQLKIRTTKQAFKKQYLTRMLKHVAAYRYRHYFEKWKHFKDLINIAHMVNVSTKILLKFYLD